MATLYRRVIRATDGTEFDLDSCSHTYTYGTNGKRATDTAFDGDHCFVQTYTYDTNNYLTALSRWVRQT